MAWNKNKLIIGFGFLCSVFVSVFSSSYSYAISDVTYTIDSTNYTQDQTFCGGSTGINCSDYSYFVIEAINSPMSNSFVNFNLYSITTNSIQPYPTPSSFIYPVNAWSTEAKYLFSNNSNSGTKALFQAGMSLTITLTDTSPTAPCPEPEEPEPCPECQVCPIVPDNPYDEKLDNITKAIYVGVATLLVIYFFYCIYRLIIKNSGVK